MAVAVTSVPASGGNPTARDASFGYKLYASPAERRRPTNLVFPIISGHAEIQATKIVMRITTVEVPIRTVRHQLNKGSANRERVTMRVWMIALPRRTSRPPAMRVVAKYSV